MEWMEDKWSEMKIWFIVCLGLSFTVCAEAGNIALGKPSSASDVSYGGTPERANDGNANPTYSGGSCMMAGGISAIPKPWWQVDLEDDYYIHSVALTNREDAFTWRLHNFTIEVYGEDPSTNPGSSFQVCALFPGTVGPGVREVLLCAPGVRGRYLRVQKNFMKNDDHLHICEIEVFGKLVTDYFGSKSVFSLFLGHRLLGTPLTEKSGTAAECGRICFNTPLCVGFNFDGGFGGGRGTCQIMFQQEMATVDTAYDCYKST